MFPDVPDCPFGPSAPTHAYAYDVFISYSPQDAAWVHGELLAWLENQGYRVCIDMRDFMPGAPLVEEQQRAIETSHRTLLVLTLPYLDSAWSAFEGLMLQALAPANQERRLIPLIKEPCPLPLRLSYLTQVNFTDLHSQSLAWSRLQMALGPSLGQARIEALNPDSIPTPAALPQGSRMPLSRNPLFVGREADLRRLAQMLHAGGTAAVGQLEIAAATGLGGIGKTQLACEFVHRYGQYFAGGVFWLSFADPAAVSAEIAACGGGEGMSLSPDFGTLAFDEQVRRVLTAWESRLPRLLIFDNCEDEALLDQWRPKHGGCRVLITSRRHHWDPSLGVQPVPLDVLPRTESIALLRTFRSDLPAEDTTLNAITEALGDLPLALHLAGSFLAKYRRAITPEQYLKRLRTPTILDDRSLREAGLSPTKHVQHVARTFEQSYERLDPADSTDRMAITLLARAACFAPGEPLPRRLLLETLELLEDDCDTVLIAEDALTRLIDLGLLEPDDDYALRLHRLLASFVRAVVIDPTAQTVVENAVLRVVEHLNTRGDPRPVLAIQPHLRFIADAALPRQDLAAAGVVTALGDHVRQIGAYAEAQRSYQQALTIRQQVLGLEHHDTATSFSKVGAMLWRQGAFAEAQRCFEQALAIQKQVLGEAHPDIAWSLHNLGLVLVEQRLYTQAWGYFEQALAIREQVLGREGLATAQCLHYLGLVLVEQGTYPQAQRSFDQALAIREELLGNDHPETAQTLNDLGEVLRIQGNLTAAQQRHEQALAIQERILGLEHPDTAWSLYHLAEALRMQGDLAAARQRHEQALAIRERVLGREHPYTARSLNDLGLVLLAQGAFAEAQRCFEQALAIREQVFGSDHLEPARSRYNLAAARSAQGERSEARQLAERALAIFEQQLGPDDPETLAVRTMLTTLAIPSKRTRSRKPRRTNSAGSATS
jgi:tetratricopeptide (TPR) repeat protein